VTALEKLNDLSGSLFIDGQFQQSESPGLFPVVDPATEQVIGQVADASQAEVERAIKVANEAQQQWRSSDFLTRSELLHGVARKLREMTPRLAEMLTREMGKPYKETADEMEWSASCFNYYAEISRHDQGRVLGPVVEQQFHYTLKEPLGVVVSIQPFNYPILLLAWQAAAAIGTGNAVIVKPSELTSLTTLAFMEAFDEFPPGIMQCLTGGGQVGAALCESKGTHMVAFTGGIETGKRVARACSEQFKPVLIEASGNDPFIVMPSANLEMAVRGGVFAAFLNCGQVCTSAERFYIHESIYDEYVSRFVTEVKKLRIGNGLEKIDLGPMVTEAERTRFEGILATAIEEGAIVETGGRRPGGFDKGWYFEPTVLSGVTPEMSILQGEIFGPAAPLCKVSSFEEAIKLANDSDYGLGANIYTQDLNESMRAANELQAGMVWVNAPLLDNDAGPFGGNKMSGLGRELGPEGLESFRTSKLVMIDPAANNQDFWWFPYSKEEAFPGNED
jgi:betaine-aldehyde dehydrogenase